MKPFASVSEQIETLESRGMIFNHDRQNTNFMILNNYYNVINSPGKFFIESDNKYIEGTSFKEIIAVYEFDKALKTILFNKIIEIEAHLRSLVSYYFFKTAPDTPYNYLDPNNYSSNNDHTRKLIADLNLVIDKHKDTPGHAINHYINRHSMVPLWVLVNHLNFGTIENMIYQMKDRSDNHIAMICSQILRENLGLNQAPTFNLKHLKSYVSAIRSLRNILAHNNRLFWYTWKTTSYHNELHSKYGIIERSNRNDVYNVFLVMQCFLLSEQYAILHNTILKRIKTLSLKLHTIDVNIILNSLGFPNDWHKNNSKLPQ